MKREREGGREGGREGRREGKGGREGERERERGREEREICRRTAFTKRFVGAKYTLGLSAVSDAVIMWLDSGPEPLMIFSATSSSNTTGCICVWVYDDEFVYRSICLYLCVHSCLSTVGRGMNVCICVYACVCLFVSMF